MPNTPSIAMVEEFEDFVGYDLQTSANKRWNETTATGGTWTIQATEDGRLRLAMGNAATAAGSMAGNVQYRPDRMGGPMTFLARVRASVAASSCVFVGFTDANNDAVIIENEDGALNTVASDAVGVLLEGEQSLKWLGISVKGDSDGALIPIGNQKDVEDFEWHEVGVTVNRDGSVYFMVNGVNSPVYDNILDPTNEYCFAVGGDGRGTAYNLEVDYYCYKGYRRQ